MIGGMRRRSSHRARTKHSYYLAVVVVTTALATLLPVGTASAGSFAAGSSARPKWSMGSCHGLYDGAFSWALQKTTQPAGGPWSRNPDTLPVVTEGEPIQVTLTWRNNVFSWQPERMGDCVEMNGGGMQLLLPATPHGVSNRTFRTSTYTTSYSVPTSAPPGSVICDRGVAAPTFGWSFLNVETSNAVCFLVGPASVTPEATSPVLLAIIAVVLLAGATFAARVRRSRRRRADPA